MEFVDAPTPEGWSPAKQRGSEARYKSSPKGRHTEWRRRGWEFVNRPFVAIDGEGVRHPDGSQRYALLSASDGSTVTDENGLSHAAILDFLLRVREANRDAILVVFGASYDWNMWVRDFTRPEAELLYSSSSQGYVKIRGNQYQWRPGKCLDLRIHGCNIRVYDVLPFFQSSFVAACDKYLSKDLYWQTHRDQIIQEKQARGAHTWADIGSLGAYNDAELVLLVKLMNELRENLDKAGIRPSRWDGPGAIATALLKKEKVHDHLPRVTPELHTVGVRLATETAYAGGRFEVFQHGIHHGRAYQYDINSAYPHALRHVPCLAHGRWEHVSGDPGNQPYALYHVRLQPGTARLPFGPLPVRASQGRIWYPRRIDSAWCWSPEMEVLRLYADQSGSRLDVIEVYSWILDGCDDPYPLDFIPAMYADRRRFKQEGNGAEHGIKLGLNSLYGKLAQQVGWSPEGKPNYVTRRGESVRIPPFHCLQWAGYTTSHCRASILRAALQNPDAVIASETDALFTVQPLELDIGNDLGQWEATEYARLGYMQSGISFLTLVDGTEVVKCRGVDKGTLTYDIYREALQANRKIPVTQKRFVTIGTALTQDFTRWCNWESQPKELWHAPQGKRIHNERTPVSDAARHLVPTLLSDRLTMEGAYTGLPHPLEWESSERASLINPPVDRDDPDVDTNGSEY